MISFENDSFNDSSFDDDRDQSKPPKTQFYTGNFSNGGAIRSLHDSCCAVIAKSMAFESVQEYAETVIQCPLPEHSQMRIGTYIPSPSQGSPGSRDRSPETRGALIYVMF